MSFDGLATFGKNAFNGGYELFESSEAKEVRARGKESVNKLNLVAKVGLAASAAILTLALIFGGPASVILSLLVCVPFGILTYDTHKVAERSEKLVDDHWKKLMIDTKEAFWKEITQDTLLLKHFSL